MLKTLHARLITALSFLVIAPIIVAGALTIRQTGVVQESQALEIQREFANRVGDELRNYISGHEYILAQLIRVRGLLHLKPNEIKSLLYEILAFGDKFEELILLDVNGRETARVHRYRLFIPDELTSRVDRDEFTRPMVNRSTYFGPVHFHTETGEPLMAIAAPIIRPADGAFRGALVGELRLKPIWDLLAKIATDEGQQVYILDMDNRVVAHPDPSVVLRETRRPSSTLIQSLGLEGTDVISAHKQVSFGSQVFTVVAEKSTTEALALARGTFRVVLLLGGLSLLMALVLIFLMLRQFVRPVKHLVEVAQSIESGDMARRAVINSDDEMGALGRAFNEMTGRLSKSLEDLKREVEVRKQAEQRLTESEERYRAVVENVQEALLVTDGRRVEFYNPKAVELTGYSEEEYLELARDFTKFVHPDDRSGWLDFQEGWAADKQQASSHEFRFLRKDGQIRWLHNNVAAIDWKGRPAMLNFINDFTDQRFVEQEKAKTEERLRQAQKMEALGTLAGGIAHDFNNILAAIIGYSELAIDDAESGAVDLKSMTEILKAGERGRDLVTQILTFSRKVEPTLKPTDLGRIILQTGKMLERTIPKMVTIEHDLAQDLWLIQADAGQMTQMIMNLCTNANDAMPEGGRLAIKTENLIITADNPNLYQDVEPGDYVQLTVSDTGHGIDRESLEHIFDPFFTTKEIGKGTGLGLATVYGIIKSHGGAVACRSSVGRGTDFYICLPAINTTERSIPSGFASTGSDQGGDETILLVDDEASVRQIGRRLLNNKGYTVKVAESGENALEIYRRASDDIDLVILDINMPGMGGFQCLDELLEINPTVKVIISSGYARSGKVSRVLDNKAKAFIPKPYSAHEMLTTVRRTLDS